MIDLSTIVTIGKMPEPERIGYETRQRLDAAGIPCARCGDLVISYRQCPMRAPLPDCFSPDGIVDWVEKHKK
jgi:hypothetical protein